MAATGVKGPPRAGKMLLAYVLPTILFCLLLTKRLNTPHIYFFAYCGFHNVSRAVSVTDCYRLCL